VGCCGWSTVAALAHADAAGRRYRRAEQADLQITEDAFDRVVWHLQATLQELEVQQQDQQAILAAVQARRDAVMTFEKFSWMSDSKGCVR
jgi:truncated hemoglobin YjbI